MVGDTVDQLINVVLVYRSKPGLMVTGVLLSIAINLCFLVTIFSLLDSLTDSHPTLGEHFLIEPISMVANAVPLPGGIGGIELVLNFLYQAFQGSAEQDFGIVVAFGFRFILLLISACGAVVWFLNRRDFQRATDWKADAEDGVVKSGVA